MKKLYQSTYDKLLPHKTLFSGVITSIVVAIAAKFLADHYQTPVMLLALLLGMAMNFLSHEPRTQPGIEFTGKTLLRWGVALLGVRITFDQISHLGWQPLLLVVFVVGCTILISIPLARRMGLHPLFGLLSGVATAICGVSAAMTIAAILPQYDEKKNHTLITVILVSSLSTVAMVLYPLAVHALALSDKAAGIFVGASIHDVSQVVGAGYAISHEAGDYATVIKLMRVSLLVPVVMLSMLWVNHYVAQENLKKLGNNASLQSAASGKIPLPPWFLWVFVGLVVVNSFGFIPAGLAHFTQDLAQWLLIMAICAIGMKTHLGELRRVGFKPITLMVTQTLFLAVLVLLLIPLLK